MSDDFSRKLFSIVKGIEDRKREEAHALQVEQNRQTIQKERDSNARRARISKRHEIEAKNRTIMNEARARANTALLMFSIQRRKLLGELDELKSGVMAQIQEAPQFREILVAQWRSNYPEIDSLFDVFSKLESIKLNELRSRIASENCDSEPSRNLFNQWSMNEVKPREPTTVDLIREMNQKMQRPGDDTFSLGLFGCFDLMKMGYENQKQMSELFMPYITELATTTGSLSKTVAFVRELADTNRREQIIQDEITYSPLKPIDLDFKDEPYNIEPLKPLETGFGNKPLPLREGTPIT